VSGVDVAVIAFVATAVALLVLWLVDWLDHR
jgi:hypothetical protein